MGRTIAGRYALRGRIGRGGMGDVYAARDLRLNRDVAVKVVDAGTISDTGRARFIREAHAAARFAHPNVVTVFDAGEADGSLYLVMELVTGHTLAAHQAAVGGPLPIRDAAFIVSSVLAALGAAHAAGVVHRDVKPANILLTPDGSVKLVDFGIATLLGEAGPGLTAAGDFVGTPKYLAPEQVAGAPAGPPTDVYAAGVILYELLTGTAPFVGDTPLATALAHRDSVAPDVRAVRADVPSRLAAVVDRALRKDPAERFASADEMRRMLAPAAEEGYLGETALFTGAAVDDPPPVRSRAARRWWWAAAAVVVAAGGVAAAQAVDDGDGGRAADASSSTATSIEAVSTTVGLTAPSTTLAPSTTVATIAPTTVALTAAAPPAQASNPAELAAVLDADPERYGARTNEVVKELGKIDGQGNDDGRRAAELLDDADGWVEAGELTAEAHAMLESVLGPIADRGEDDEDEGEGDGDGDD